MGLYEDREALQSEKQTYLERLQKLEEKRDKVKSELYEKLRGELDDKIVDVQSRLKKAEEAIQEEEQREQAARQEEMDGKRHEWILEKYADELVSLQNQWQQRQEEKKQELQGHADALREQRKELEEQLGDVKNEKEELNLRKEIGEFDDSEDEFKESTAKFKSEIEQLEGDLNARDAELGKVAEQIEELGQKEMPDFTEEVLAEHADEEPEPEPEPEEEEVYEPEEEEIYEPEEEELEEEIVTEEEISEEDVSEGEELVTEVEEVYEDEAEEAFFSSNKSQNIISATINPCLIERTAEGEERVHNLILGGAKTLIGSSELCDVYLPYPSVDTKHSWIKVDRKAQYLIKDLGSKTGTFVNGKKTKKAYLENGDRIKIGDIRLTVKLI